MEHCWDMVEDWIRKSKIWIFFREEKKLNAKFFKEVLEKALIGYKNKDDTLEITAVNDVTGEVRFWRKSFAR